MGSPELRLSLSPGAIMKNAFELLFSADKNGAVTDLLIRIPINELEELIANARKQEPVTNEPTPSSPIVVNHERID